jgi:hypothetical protein
VKPGPEQNLPFDRVVIVDRGARKELTVTAFLALPLAVRVGHLLGSGLEFFQGAERVDRAKALNLLRQYRSTT